MLLPLLMDIETDGSRNTKIIDIYDYVYLDTGKRILKFRVEINEHMEIVNALESCVDNINVKDFCVMSEKKIKEISTVPVKFLPYVGKFKLEENFIKTNNYLAPKMNDLTKLVLRMYKQSTMGYYIVNSSILEELANVNLELSDKKDINILNNLLANINVTLVDEYDCDSELLKSNISSIGKVVDHEYGASLLHRFKWILTTSKSNVENIKYLNIEDKFIDAVKEANKPKVKSM